MEMFSILGVVEQESSTVRGGENYLGMEKLAMAGGSLLDYRGVLQQAWGAGTPAAAGGALSVGDMWFFCILVVLIVVLGLAGAMFVYFRCGCSGGGAKKAAERELCAGMIP